MSFRFGIDLGGTKIELIALDRNGAPALRQRVPTPAGDYNATVKAITDLVQASAFELGCGPDEYSVGVGIPGTLSADTGRVKNANSTCLIGNPLKQDLEVALQHEVRIANDADCFALSEATDGTGVGHGIVFGVILGTGVGGGLVVNGQIVRGPNSITGEWGHNPLPWPNQRLDEAPGPTCYCGKTGCIETFLSGPGMMRDARQTDEQCDGQNKWRTPSDVVAAAADQDPRAEACMNRYYDRLARGLASLINVLDPDIIVLGGGLSNIDALYDEIPGRWGAYVFSDTVLTKLARNTHGDSSGVRGAAWLWPEKL